MGKRRTKGAVAALAASLILTGAAWAGEPVAWSFDEATEGEDVAWVSPTAVDPAAPRFDFAWEITLLEIRVRWLNIPFTVDVTGEVPEEFRVGSGILDGPPPIVLIQDRLVFPPPPEPPGIEADVDLRIDAEGFGRLSMTDVVLGQVEVEIPPFGVQTVDLERVRVAGDVVVTPLGPAADINGDGTVDFADLVAMLAAWGTCPDPPEDCPADVNGDGFVTFDDLLALLAQWGQSYKGC